MRLADGMPFALIPALSRKRESEPLLHPAALPAWLPLPLAGEGWGEGGSVSIEKASNRGSRAPMTPLDWIAILIAVVSMLIGFVRGLVFEGLLLVGWVAAFVFAQWEADAVGRWLPGDLEPVWRYGIGFALVFVAVAFCAGLLASAVRRLVTAAGLRPVDRVLGGVFGIARSVVALLAIAVVAHLLTLTDTVWWRESRGAVWLDAALQSLKPALPEKLAGYLP
jgi:membrane protein required for colicin V production